MEYASSTKYYRRKFAQGTQEWLGHYFTGPGGEQPGGFYLVSEDGGKESTKQISLSKPEIRDITGLLAAFGAKGKGLKMPKNVTIPDVINSTAGLAQETLPKSSDTSSDKTTISKSDSVEVCKYCRYSRRGKAQYTTEDHGGERIKVSIEEFNKGVGGE